MKSDGQVRVAIVGGGASGTILAVQLARRGIRSALIDGSGRMGRGVAYSTKDDAHLLNVRAEVMGAFAGEPLDFAIWLEKRGEGEKRDFARRRLFADYLGELLDGAVRSGQVEAVQATAVGAERVEDSWHVSLDNGEAVTAEALVLAIGNQEPSSLRAFEGCGPRYIGNPWGSQAQAAVRDLVETGGSALLVGTGLTMVDLVLSLDAAGHDGRIVALSRRGQVPRSHTEYEPMSVERDALPLGDLRSMFRWVRTRGGEVGWRAAVDSLRPHSHAVWQTLPRDQQQRFMRHARPWWDVHRHRIAPEVGATVARLVAGGFLEVVAGRVVAATPISDGIEVEYRKRQAPELRSERFSYVFNCTGPLQAIERTRDSLLRQLLEAGRIRPDQLGIGVAVDEHSRVEPSSRLWALGPLTKGRYWEIIAVPDIREQAALVADDIAEELDQ
jgi:uncharacterized NAD(P)/FAD-binding protein YdhS